MVQPHSFSVLFRLPDENPFYNLFAETVKVQLLISLFINEYVISKQIRNQFISPCFYRFFRTDELFFI